MWGSGARDDFTIPSSLARMLTTEFPGRVEVFNFGQSGYVSTQEMIAFLRELQYDNRPDVALFYDGYNDMFSSFQQGIAGLPQNEFHREQEFNLPRSSRTLDLVKALVRQSHVYMLLQAAAKRPTASPPAANNEQLAHETARIYAENIRLLEALGKSEGVGMLLYLQPSLFTKTVRTPYENSWYNRYQTQAVFNDQFYAAVRQTTLPPHLNFHDISDALNHFTESYYIDLAHTTERGNEVIARRMYENVAPLLARRLTTLAPRPPSDPPC